jgi:hypothetical protein
MAKPGVLEQLNDFYSRLSERDRLLLVMMGLALSAFAVFISGVSLGRAAQKRSDRIASKSQQLREVSQLTVGYRQAEQTRQDLERRLKDHAMKNLFSYLDDLSKKDEISIGNMTDKGSEPAGDKTSKVVRSSVEVTVTHVEIDKLTKFLNDVESNPGIIKVTRLQVRPRKDDAVLDAWFTVSTYFMGS